MASFSSVKGIVYKVFLAVGLLTVVVVNVFRFYNLNDIPYGAQVDEIGGAVTVQCLATEGIDAHKRPWPLFSKNFGTPKPPTYLYPAVLWAKMFGFSFGSFRSLIAFFFILALVGFFFLARLFFGFEYGFWALLLGSISPWAWNFSRVSFESLTTLTFIIWGLFFLFRPARMFNLILGGIFLSLAMYAYPPVRLQMPLMVVPILIYRSLRGGFSLGGAAVVVLAFVITTLPLAMQILSGQLMTRYNDISIFSKDYLASIGSTGSWQDLLKLFIGNYFSHFRPDYLFMTGDENYIHSTRRFGILSWADMGGFIAGAVVFVLAIFKRIELGKEKESVQFVIFLLIGILIAIVPAATTNEGLPHSLRTIGAWPFVMLLASFGLWQASRLLPGVMPAGVVIVLVFAVMLMNVYFREYPQKSKGMFGFWTREEAEAAKTDEDWLRFMYRYRGQDYHFMYYLMNKRGLGCAQTRDMWINFGKYLEAKGLR